VAEGCLAVGEPVASPVPDGPPGYGAMSPAPVSGGGTPAFGLNVYGYGPPAGPVSPAAGYGQVSPAPTYGPVQSQPPPSYGPVQPQQPPTYGPVQPQRRHWATPPWTALVQVLDLAIGESAGYTLRCYLPSEHPEEDPDAVFLTSDRRLLVFDELPDLVEYVRSTNAHDLAPLTDWHLVSSGIDGPSAERFTMEAYELDLIQANVAHGTREWSPDLFVAARDLAVELANALDLRPVLKAFSGGSLLDELDDTMRAHQGRRASSWWKDRRLSPDEVIAVRETWRRAVTIIEAAIWPGR
jgi:hypothetical protein